MEDSSFTALNLWQNADGKTLLQDQRKLSFHAPNEQDRAIDVAITLKAAVDDVTFGDTKEGSMGIRMNPSSGSKDKLPKAAPSIVRALWARLSGVRDLLGFPTGRLWVKRRWEFPFF